MGAMRMPTAPGSLAGTTVLVVDDDEDFLELLSVMLGCRGATVRCAHDAEEALMLLEDDQVFDVIVSDIEMPGARGTELISHIRQSANPRLAVIPAIALTASSNPATREEALAVGYSRHLMKPVDVVTLSGEIAVLGRHRRRN